MGSDQTPHQEGMTHLLQPEQEEAEEWLVEQHLWQQRQRQTNTIRLALQLLEPFYEKRRQILQKFDEHALISTSPHRDYAAEIDLLLEIQDRYRELVFDLHAIRQQVAVNELDQSLRKFFSGSRLLELLMAATSLVASTQQLVKEEEQSRSHGHLPSKEKERRRKRHRLQ